MIMELPDQGGNPFGGMAQLVARLHGMQKVRGSNPLTSTNIMSREIGKTISRDTSLLTVNYSGWKILLGL